MENQQPTLSNWLTLIFLGAVWGSSFILMKKALISFSASQVAGLRVAISFLVFFPFALRYLKKIPKEKWKYIAAVGALGSLFPAYLFAKAQTQLDSAPAGILNSLTPLFTFLWGISLFGQKGNLQRFLGILLGFVGACLLIIDPNQGFSLNEYALLIVLATILYGLSGNVTKHYLQEVNPIHITAVSFFFVGLPALILLGSTDVVSVLQNDPESWKALGYVSILSLGGTALALMLFWKLVQDTDALFGAIVTYLIPIVAIIWGIVDGESLQLIQYFGFGLILISVFLMGKKKATTKKP
ncbi:MAG: DMT family transporter [Saprospiraceae bacterium]|nr:DMT family transporter [Saprospiraceae bacterium]